MIKNIIMREHLKKQMATCKERELFFISYREEMISTGQEFNKEEVEKTLTDLITEQKIIKELLGNN